MIVFLCLHVEIVFVFFIVIFFIFGIIRRNKSKDFDLEVFKISSFIIIAVFYLLISFYSEMDYSLIIECLDGDFYVSKFINLMKMFILCVFGIFILFFYFVKDEGFPYFEFVLLTFISILGGFILLMANNLMIIYVSLELQSLVLYVLPIISFVSGNWFKEAAFKYFIFGVIASSLILLGISFVYGFCGALNLHQLAHFFDFDKILNLEFRFLIGILFFLIGILFKLGVVPFHFWIADVYQGSPLTITFFFATIPKTALVFLFLKVFNIFFLSFFYNLVLFLGLLSIIYGTIIALYEIKIMRLFAFASISHVGYILIGMTQISVGSISNIVFYLFMYMLLVLTFFCILLNFRVSKGHGVFYIFTLTDLCNIWKFDKTLSICLVLNVLSMAGLPPFGGFFMKFGIFLNCILQHNYILFLFLLFFSIINIVFYIRLIRFIFFEAENRKDIKFIKYEKGPGLFYFLIIVLTLLNVLCCFYYPFLFSFLNLILS